MAFGQVGGMSFTSPEFLTGFTERNWALRDREDAQNFSAQSAQAQMQFQADMSNSAYQRAVNDMRAAGLNPMLAYQQGGASAPQGAGFPGILPHRTGFGSSVGGSFSGITAAQVANLNAGTSKIHAEERRTDAETDEIREGKLPHHKASVEGIQQSMRESAAKIDKIIADTDLSRTSAMHMSAEIAKLQAQLPEIQSHIKEMQEHVRLMQSSRGEIDQRIKANLPDMLRQLDQINIILKRYTETGHRLDKEAGEGLLGAIDRVMRAIRGRLMR